MTEKKVAELEGVELDYWAGKAVGDPVEIKTHALSRELVVISGCRLYSPTTDWKRGGPLLESYGIIVGLCLSTKHKALARVEYTNGGWHEAVGRSYLEAGMRALVMFHYGPTVPGEE